VAIGSGVVTGVAGLAGWWLMGFAAPPTLFARDSPSAQLRLRLRLRRCGWLAIGLMSYAFASAARSSSRICREVGQFFYGDDGGCLVVVVAGGLAVKMPVPAGVVLHRVRLPASAGRPPVVLSPHRPHALG
jgi:hypothetical protein